MLIWVVCSQSIVESMKKSMFGASKTSEMQLKRLQSESTEAAVWNESSLDYRKRAVWKPG